ncbi:MAG TPA: hypothetical protein VHO26_02045 [Propionibacteriaceae bacterium]|nr:hypothetical protein [Propionibacteriaceae bacterium]
MPTNDESRYEQETHPQLTPEQDQAERGGEPPAGPDPTVTPDPADPAEVKRVRAWLGDKEHPPRQDGLWPYLLIRAFPGDTGVRQPPVNYFWESPDIRVYEGDVQDPSTATPVINPTPGVAHSVFVHVWNLGRLEAVGVTVRAWWANPAFSFGAGSPEPPHYIGGTRVNLGDRTSPDCHALVRIQGLWTPVVENSGHECLLAVATHVMDPASGGFTASTDRHVAQHNLMLAAPSEDLSPLLTRLGAALTLGSDLQLLHGGADVAPILLAHKAVVGRDVVLPQLTDVVTPVPGLPNIGHLGTVVRTLGGHAVVPGAASVRALTVPNSLTAINRPGLLGGRVSVQPATLSPAVAVIRALKVPDLTAGSIAKAVSTSSGDGNLLRFQEVRGGVVVGGYSVIVQG